MNRNVTVIFVNIGVVFIFTTVPLTFKVETSEYERGDTGYAGHLAIKPSNRAFQIN